MGTLIEQKLRTRMMEISDEVHRYRAHIAAERLLKVSELLYPQRFDPSLLDFIPLLLDPKPVQQEIEVAALRDGGPWKSIWTVSLPLLLAFAFLTVLLAVLAYSGLWPASFHNGIPLVLSLSVLVDLVLFSLWSLSLWRIQSSKRRVEQICARISLDLQDVAQEFLLAVALNSNVPRNFQDALYYAAERIDKAMKDLVDGSYQTFQTLEKTNQEAVSTLHELNDDIRGRVDSFDQQIAPALLSFQTDIAGFRSMINDYQREMTRANGDLVHVLQTIATTSEGHLALEQSLRRQIGDLNSLQQMAVTRTEAIAASMSATAQSIVHIADQIANQPQQISIEAQGEVNVARLEARSDFDVYLCHDSKDTPAVKAIAEQLKQKGIKPWLDEWEIAPGMPWQSVLEQQIARIRSVAVFVGQDGGGPWQNIEQRTILQEFVERGCPVIPVILPGYDGTDPDLPPFLRSFTWVDFRQKEPDPLKTLAWGVTGRR